MAQGVSDNFNPRLGRQLSHRVSTGAITAGQAKHTAYEREVLEQAFGPNWREKIYGKGGAQAISGPFARNVIRQKRSRALTRARKKLGPLRGGTAGMDPLNPQSPVLY